MSKVIAYYHIVFCTKNREMTIPLQLKEDLYRFIWKIITDKNCKLLRIGGIQNNIHILLDLHPNIALATLVQSIKGVSSGWLRQDGRITVFDGWAAGYFASSVSPEGKGSVIEYIKNQEEHHMDQGFDEELKGMHLASFMDYDERDMR